MELSLNKPTAHMWDKILSTFKDALAKAETAYLKKATSASYLLMSFEAGNSILTEQSKLRLQLHLRREQRRAYSTEEAGLVGFASQD